MKINKQARRDGKTLFRSCLVSGRLDEGRVRTAVDSVLEKKPRGYLAALHHFLRLMKLEVQLGNLVDLQVITVQDFP